MVAVSPNATGLNLATRTVCRVHLASPDARAQTVESVICNLHGLLEAVELRNRNHRTKDLLLEDSHVVGAFEDGRFNVVAAR